MLYREGMPGSILCAGICAVVYFVVGIRFGNELVADDCTSIGEFSMLLLIVILSALLVKSYCKKASVVWYIGGIGVGGTLLEMCIRDRPSTGEILCMVSAPTFDPRLMVGRQRGKNHLELARDSWKPLLNRSITVSYTHLRFRQ